MHAFANAFLFCRCVYSLRWNFIIRSASHRRRRVFRRNTKVARLRRSSLLILYMWLFFFFKRQKERFVVGGAFHSFDVTHFFRCEEMQA